MTLPLAKPAQTPSQPLSRIAARMLARGQRELREGRVDDAVATMDSALALAPDHPDVLRCAGTAAQLHHDNERAADCFRQVLAVYPNDSALHVGLGIALFELGDPEGALRCLKRACELNPTDASGWFNYGEALRQEVRTDEALAALRRALSLKPGHIAARLTLARAYASQGDIDAGVREFREVLRRDPGNAKAWFGLANLQTVRFNAQETGRLRAAFAQQRVAGEAHDLLGFALAKALEDQHDYVGAFDVFEVVNAARRKTVKWDGHGEHRRIETIQRVFSGSVAASPDPDMGRETIVIVSIPRSGSTLVEHILSSHPEVEGANEIKDMGRVIDAETARRHSAFPLWVPDASADDWQRLGNEYLARTARWREHKPRFVDKNLVTWYLVGATLAMLPAARCVVVRRDPLETCLACFRQWFTGESGFTYNLDEMATYCIDFMRLTRFWAQQYPERVFDLEYETLVAEPEPTIRRLLDFCGLPFDPACLDFQHTRRTVLSAPSTAQVRQPIRSDTARAHLYGDKLDALRQRLHDAGL